MASREKKPVEVVVFQNPAKRKKPKDPATELSHKEAISKQGTTKPKFFDQKKFRYDVRKLGIHGLNKKDKETAVVDFLVELGAKPPKNKCYHIQEYQKIMRQKREEEKKLEELERKAGIKPKKKQAKQKKGKDDILNHVDGQVGFFKDGVQFIKKMKR